jgi:hypothetical protein
MLTITVLTGRRPALLEQTLRSMVERQSEVWHMATRTVVHNGGDRETAEVLDGYLWDDRKVLRGRLRSIGEASQYLLKQAAQADNPYVLRLEDDWEATSSVWLDDAVAMLSRSGQIRLRREDEKVMDRHRITREPIAWRTLANGHKWTPSAHFTHNPNLMRTWDAVSLAGYKDEVDAAERFHATGLASSQLVPGVFKHLGHRHQGLSLKWSL